MYVTKTAVWLGEFPDARLCVSNYFSFLARDAGGRPGFHVSSDGVPHVLGLEQLDRCLARRMREAMHHVEDCFPEGGRHPGSRGTSTGVADDRRSLGYLDLFENNLGVLRKWRRR